MPLTNSNKSEHPLVGKGLLFHDDPRDEQHLMFGGETPNLKDIIRHSWKIGTILDQGSQSSCVGHAWTQFLQTDPFKTDKGGHEYAYELYREAQKHDPWPGEEPDNYGTTVRAGADVLLSRGLIRSCVWARNVDQMAAHVATRGSIVMGTKWFQGMGQPDPNGFARPQGTYEGGHAWLVYGVDVEWESFMCCNSWGTGWGKNGRFFVRFKDMEFLLNNNGQACSALEK